MSGDRGRMVVRDHDGEVERVDSQVSFSTVPPKKVDRRVRGPRPPPPWGETPIGLGPGVRWESW